MANQNTDHIPCPKHPHILLPVAEREAEKHICCECAQAQRKATYAQQKLEWGCRTDPAQLSFNFGLSPYTVA